MGKFLIGLIVGYSLAACFVFWATPVLGLQSFSALPWDDEYIPHSAYIPHRPAYAIPLFLFGSLLFLYGFVCFVGVFVHKKLSIVLLSMLLMGLGIYLIDQGFDTIYGRAKLAPIDHRSEDVRVFAVIIAELELGDRARMK
jgi:hypothetical protein